MWKALIAGESVNINTKYHNFNWKGGLPCIILTNEIGTAHYWTNSDLFNTQCVFVNIRRYMGPTGTRPEFLCRYEEHFDFDMKAQIDEWVLEKQKKKNNPFDLINKY
jgi:hypothetical protein